MTPAGRLGAQHIIRQDVTTSALVPSTVAGVVCMMDFQPECQLFALSRDIRIGVC